MTTGAAPELNLPKSVSVGDTVLRTNTGHRPHMTVDSVMGAIEDSISQCTFLQMTYTAENLHADGSDTPGDHHHHDAHAAARPASATPTPRPPHPRQQMLMMSFICSYRNKNQPKSIYPKGTSHHTRLFRGPSTNDIKSRMVLADPGPLLTRPPPSSPPKTPHLSSSAQTRSQNEEKTPPKKTVPAPADEN
jgi:hypothetical protein